MYPVLFHLGALPVPTHELFTLLQDTAEVERLFLVIKAQPEY